LSGFSIFKQTRQNTYVVVQLSLDVDVVVHNVGRPDIAVDIFKKISQLGSTNAISAVHVDGGQYRFSLHQGLESFRKLDIIAFLSGLAVGVVSTLGIEASNQVMKLRCCLQTKINRFSTSCIKTILQSSNKGSAAWSEANVRFYV
jgi:hypothetical protein